MMRHLLRALVIITVFRCCMGQQMYTPTLESELRASLFTNYEVLQRPFETNNITISMNLISVNSLDIKSQQISTSGFFQMGWSDNRLSWKSNSTYNNVKFLFSNENYMWRPAIAIENRVSDFAVFSDTNSLIRIIPSGDARWTPGGIFETSCEADVTYYPFDIQECSVVLTSWAYTSNELSLSFESPSFNLDNFHENGEWQLLSTSTSTKSSQRSSKESYTYDRLYFTLKLKRRPLFHILNTIFPVILMASLICFVFKLPPESGERIGLSLTILLAYAVYLTLIGDNIPKTSRTASILSIYLTMILLMSALSVVLTIVVLDIYFNHEDDEDLPGWLQTLTRVALVKVAMWKGIDCCSKRQKVNPEGCSIEKEKHHVSTEKLKPEDVYSITSDKSSSTSESSVKNYSWKEVALVLDRCFMYLFIALTVICTVVCMGIIVANSAQN